MDSLTDIRRRLCVATAALAVASTFATLAFAQNDAKKSHTFRGTVEKVDRKSAKLTVNGEDVAGWMPAMTMSYRVDNPAVLGTIKAGAHIEATVYDNDLTLHEVRVVAPPGDKK